MKRLFVVAAIAAALLPESAAVADDDTGAGTSGTGFWLHEVHHGQGSGDGSGGDDAPGNDVETHPVLIGDGACDAADQVAGEFLDAGFCSGSEVPVLTTADVQKAFAELKLDPGTLVIQPPDGLTLVNFKTNFYTTTTTPTTLTVTLLDQPVTLEATPTTYTWHFGDGQTTSTTEPGAAYPALTITHEYLRKGDYGPSLSTTYTGRYKIGAGPWQTIPGTVTIDGPDQALRAIEAQPKLVGY